MLFTTKGTKNIINHGYHEWTRILFNHEIHEKILTTKFTKSMKFLLSISLYLNYFAFMLLCFFVIVDSYEQEIVGILC